MTVALAKKGFVIDRNRPRRVGFAVATDLPFSSRCDWGRRLVAARTRSATPDGHGGRRLPGRCVDRLAYPLSLDLPVPRRRVENDQPPPPKSGPFTTIAVALRAIRLYPIPGRRVELKSDRSGQTVAACRQGVFGGRTSDATQRIGRRGGQRLRTSCVCRGLEGCSEPGWELEPTHGLAGRRVCDRETRRAELSATYRWTIRSSEGRAMAAATSS
jgi:hypothetical protein